MHYYIDSAPHVNNYCDYTIFYGSNKHAITLLKYLSVQITMVFLCVRTYVNGKVGISCTRVPPDCEPIKQRRTRLPTTHRPQRVAISRARQPSALCAASQKQITSLSIDLFNFSRFGFSRFPKRDTRIFSSGVVKEYTCTSYW